MAGLAGLGPHILSAFEELLAALDAPLFPKQRESLGGRCRFGRTLGQRSTGREKEIHTRQEYRSHQPKEPQGQPIHFASPLAVASWEYNQPLPRTGSSARRGLSNLDGHNLDHVTVFVEAR